MRSHHVPLSRPNRHRQNSCLTHSTAGRRGLATLETVLSFPVLIALAAMLLAVGSASVQKCGVAVEARHKAWSQRTASLTTEFLVRDLEKGFLQGSADSPVRLPPGLRSMDLESTATARSRHGLIVGPWDDPKAGFEGKFPNYTPHMEPLMSIAASSTLGNFQLYSQRGSSFSDVLSSLNQVDSELNPALKTLREIHQTFDPLKPPLKFLDALTGTLNSMLDSKKEGGGPLGSILDAGSSLIGGAGKLVQGLGEKLGGDVGKALEKLGKDVEVTAKMPKVIRAGINAFNELMRAGIQSSQGLADAFIGGPGPAAFSDESLVKLNESAIEIQEVWKELEEVLKELGF